MPDIEEDFDPCEALEAIAELDEKVRDYFGSVPMEYM